MNFNHFDLPSLALTLDAMQCRNGHRGADFHGIARSEETGDLKYARLICHKCEDDIIVNGRPYLWMPMPALPAKQKRQRRSTYLPPLGTEFCWICNWDVPMLATIGRGLQMAHPIDQAAAIDAHRDPMDHLTFPLCDHHHAYVDTERRHYAQMLKHWQVANSLILPPTGIERPMLLPSDEEETP
jgi:hypothetical protein